MSPSELIGKGQKVYTPEEFTRRLEKLQSICDVLAERLDAVDGNTLFETISTRGMKIVFVPKEVAPK